MHSHEDISQIIYWYRKAKLINTGGRHLEKRMESKIENIREKGKEEDKESISETRKEEIEEGDILEVIEKRFKTSIEDSLLYSDREFEKFRERVLNSPINLELLIEPINIETMLGYDRLSRITFIGKTRGEKWFIKRGKQLASIYEGEQRIAKEQELLNRMQRFQFFYAYLLEAVHVVTDKYGINGPEFTTYHNLALFIVKKLKKAGISEFPEIVKRTIKRWVEERKAKEEIAKLVAVMTCGVYLLFLRNQGYLW